MSRLFHILLLAAFLVGAFQGDVLAQDVARGESEQPVAVHEAGVPMARAIQPLDVAPPSIPVGKEWMPGAFSLLFRNGTTPPWPYDARRCRAGATWFYRLPLYDSLHVYRC